MVLKISSFIVAMTTEYLFYYIGISNTFIGYGLISTLCFVYLKEDLEETKGMSHRHKYIKDCLRNIAK